MTKLTQQQFDSYIATIDHVIETYPNEKVQQHFEMSIDMCDAVDWDDEDECGFIFDSYQLLNKETV